MKKIITILILLLLGNNTQLKAQKFGINIYDSLWLSTFLPNMMSLDENEFEKNYEFYDHIADSIIENIEGEVKLKKFKYSFIDKTSHQYKKYDYNNYLDFIELRLTCSHCFDTSISSNINYLNLSSKTKNVYQQLEKMDEYIKEDTNLTDSSFFWKYYGNVLDSMYSLDPTNKVDAYLSFCDIVMEQDGKKDKLLLPLQFYYIKPNKQFVLSNYYNILINTSNQIQDIDEKVDAYLKISDYYFKHDMSYKSILILFQVTTLKELKEDKNIDLRETVILKLFNTLKSSRKYNNISDMIVLNEFERHRIFDRFLSFSHIKEEDMLDEDLDNELALLYIFLTANLELEPRNSKSMTLWSKFALLYFYKADTQNEIQEELMNLFFTLGKEEPINFPFDKSNFYENRLFRRTINPDGDLNKSLEEYCFIQIIKNNWNKASSVLEKYGNEYKQINSLNLLLGVLINKVKNPDFIKDRLGFLNFMQTVNMIAYNEKIKKNNESALLSNYYYLFANYYQNYKPFTQNLVDSIEKFGYLGNSFNPNYQENVPELLAQIYWSGDSVVSLNNTVESRTKEIKKLNKELKWKSVLASILLFVSGLLFLPILWQAKKIKVQRGIKEVLEREVSNLETTIDANKQRDLIQTLMRNTNEHDVDNAYIRLESDIREKRLSSPATILSKLNIVNKYADTYRLYKNQIKDVQDIKHISTIEEEILRIQRYIQLYKITYDSEPLNIIFNVDGVAKDLLLTPIPYKMIQNFVLNSLKHGTKSRSEIEIKLHVSKVGEEIVCEILDNGVGFDLMNISMEGKGFELITDLVTLYNSEKSNLYYIEFALNDEFIQSKIGKGTKIIFNIKSRKYAV